MVSTLDFESSNLSSSLSGTYLSLGCPGGSAVKNAPAKAGGPGDAEAVSRSGRSPGGGHGSPLQSSCLGNLMDRGAWRATVRGVAKGQTRLSNYTTARLAVSPSRSVSQAFGPAGAWAFVFSPFQHGGGSQAHTEPDLASLMAARLQAELLRMSEPQFPHLLTGLLGFLARINWTESGTQDSVSDKWQRLPAGDEGFLEQGLRAPEVINLRVEVCLLTKPGEAAEPRGLRSLKPFFLGGSGNLT